ncbi:MULTISPECIES: leucyl/phenylalanyl-tRNA--protein transferase [unclassified Iodidimonas]|jgi:leucyl/phenylalanyl-tRNA--protein transferase|uniref:leucyl/phenylalanyl-tRNA--protein transferase n=1 Tax=unclassified Iodidimonas TaxID=2626145 RepID=UPI0024828623|nr:MULTISPECIES: leucyl/phenylalanyl-tRNA--protein transferase [unclassified Iodidimonas]
MARLTPELLLRAYACGLFPMAESQTASDIFWVDPENRGILPLSSFHISRSLKRVVRKDLFDVRINTAFRDVMIGCASPAPDRADTWINDQILAHYCRLHEMGAAHSVECWQDGRLVGGLYGVDLAGAFFGESMFHRVTDASKVAMVHLVARLKYGGYQLLDTQFVTEHLQQFGAREINRDAYHELLKSALRVQGDFYSLPEGLSGERVLHAITHTS